MMSDLRSAVTFYRLKSNSSTMNAVNSSSGAEKKVPRLVQFSMCSICGQENAMKEIKVLVDFES